jgi:hypothetical protein
MERGLRAKERTSDGLTAGLEVIAKELRQRKELDWMTRSA